MADEFFSWGDWTPEPTYPPSSSDFFSWTPWTPEPDVPAPSAAAYVPPSEGAYIPSFDIQQTPNQSYIPSFDTQLTPNPTDTSYPSELGAYLFGGEGTRNPIAAPTTDVSDRRELAAIGADHYGNVNNPANMPAFMSVPSEPSVFGKISGYADDIAAFGKKHSNLLSGVAGAGEGIMRYLANKKAREDYEKKMREYQQKKAAATAEQSRAVSPLNMAAYLSGAQRQRLRPGISDYRQSATSPEQRLHFTPAREGLAQSMIREGQRAAEGGMIEGYAKGGATKGGLGQVSTSRLVRGSAPGQSDKVPAMLSPGEYVFDADAVAAAGDGNTEAGARKLDEMRMAMRAHKRSAPANKIPPKAKEPMQYMKGGKA